MIYTCYFGGLGGRTSKAVSVCRQQPPKWKLPIDYDLAPPYGMYWSHLRGRISDRRFAQLYKMRFSLLDPAEIAAKYDGWILTAWEAYEDKERTKLKFSHRHMIADWLRSYGYEVKELEPMTRKRRLL